MNKKRAKVAISGAAGNIGYALLFRIASGEMPGQDVEIELQLLEIEPVLGTLEGIAMELKDCAFPLLKKISITSDANEAFKNANYALLVGAAPRKKGMERSDLLAINGKIFTGQGKALNDNAADDIKILVVGNPCNTNCLIAMHNAKDIPNDRFFAMTMLDEKRARAQLAFRAEVDVTEINNMAIWGNHSSTQYPDFYHAFISGKPVLEVINDEKWLQDEFIKTVQQRGAAVIKAIGSSSAASAANAAMATITNLVFDTPENECFSVGLCSKGEYGIDDGLIFSYPCRTKNGQLEIIKGLEHNDFAKQKLLETKNELLQEKELVAGMGLI